MGVAQVMRANKMQKHNATKPIYSGGSKASEK